MVLLSQQPLSEALSLHKIKAGTTAPWLHTNKGFFCCFFFVTITNINNLTYVGGKKRTDIKLICGRYRSKVMRTLHCWDRYQIIYQESQKKWQKLNVNYVFELFLIGTQFSVLQQGRELHRCRKIVRWRHHTWRIPRESGKSCEVSWIIRNQLFKVCFGLL